MWEQGILFNELLARENVYIKQAQGKQHKDIYYYYLMFLSGQCNTCAVVGGANDIHLIRDNKNNVFLCLCVCDSN